MSIIDDKLIEDTKKFLEPVFDKTIGRFGFDLLNPVLTVAVVDWFGQEKWFHMGVKGVNYSKETLEKLKAKAVERALRFKNHPDPFTLVVPSNWFFEEEGKFYFGTINSAQVFRICGGNVCSRSEIEVFRDYCIRFDANDTPSDAPHGNKVYVGAVAEQFGEEVCGWVETMVLQTIVMLAKLNIGEKTEEYSRLV